MRLTKVADGGYPRAMETIVVNVGQAKTHLSKLLAQAEAGNTVVVARDGKPVVQLTPVAKPKRRFGFWPDLHFDDSAFFDPLPEEELALWEDGPVFPELPPIEESMADEPTAGEATNR
jgi:prevent-host-death family protein